ISRVKLGYALLPHADKGSRRDVIDVFPDALDGRKRIAPDGAFPPLFAFFLAFVGSAHRAPCKAVRVAHVFCRALNALLVNEVHVIQSWLPVSERLKQDPLSDDLKGGSDSVVPRITNVARSVLLEFVLAELEQANIRTGALLGIEARLDLGDRLHEGEVQSHYLCDPPDLLDRRPGRHRLQRVENRICWLGLGRQLRISVIS